MAKMTFNFKDQGLDKNLEYFVADQPIPVSVDGPQITPAQWWKSWVIRNTKQAIQRGKNKTESMPIDEDVIT
jgi:hypothetical protein